MDETGYQIGQGKNRNLITPRRGYNIPTGGQHELMTGIKCIAANGQVMLPWFLPKGNSYIEEWYTNIDIPDFRIKPIVNGQITDEAVFKWLYSFYKASKSQV